LTHQPPGILAPQHRNGDTVKQWLILSCCNPQPIDPLTQQLTPLPTYRHSNTPTHRQFGTLSLSRVRSFSRTLIPLESCWRMARAMACDERRRFVMLSPISSNTSRIAQAASDSLPSTYTHTHTRIHGVVRDTYAYTHTHKQIRLAPFHLHPHTRTPAWGCERKMAIHTYTQTNMTHSLPPTHIYKHAYMGLLETGGHTHKHTHTHTHTHTHICLALRPANRRTGSVAATNYTHTHTQTHRHADTQTFKNTHKITHTHTHTHTQLASGLAQGSASIVTTTD